MNIDLQIPTQGPQTDLRDPERLAALAATGLTATADDAFDRYADLVRACLKVPVALVSLVDASRQFFPGQAGLGGAVGAARETPLTHSFCQHVVLTGLPLVTSDARTDPLLADNMAIPDLGVIGYAGMPLTDASGRVLGSLCAIDTGPHDWTPDELTILAGLAKTCSAELRMRILLADLAVARARVESANERLAILAEASRALTSSLDSSQTLRRLLRLAVPRLADWAIVTEVDASGQLGTAIGTHRDPDLATVAHLVAEMQADLSTEASLVQQVARDGQAILVPHVPAGFLDRVTVGGVFPELVAQLGLDSVLAVPLQGHNRLLAVLVIANMPGSRPLDDSDREVVGDLGRRAGLAWENAQIFGRQTRAAEVLQRSMLTKLPEPDHLHLVARYLPAAREAQVGGDWYDAFLQPDGATVLVIGDVVGHDIDAAASMSQVRTMLRGMAYDRGTGPADILTRIDMTMTGLDTATLATVVVARIEQTDLDASTGLRRLRWSNAGHPPPLILEPDGSVTVLEGEADLMLGVDHSSPRTEHVAELAPGATILLYTDGLIERRDNDLTAGIAGLGEALAGGQHEPLQDLCDALIASLVNADVEDDIAIIAARAYPDDSPRPVEAGPVKVVEPRPTVD